MAIAPEAPDVLRRAVEEGGGTVVAPDDGPDALVWTAPSDAAGLRAALKTRPVRWVQLPFAGVERFAAEGVLIPDLTWTCAKGVYSRPVAEHALALSLAGLRRLPTRARATSWGEQDAATLYDAPVVVLALALTPETEHVIGARQLELMDERAWLVNVARGRHVDTHALVNALQHRQIGGAALDVTDPEPLPDHHPLWSLDNALVTPHTANPWQTAQPLLAARVRENVRRFAQGDALLGLVDVGAGY